MFQYSVHGGQWQGERSRQEDAFSILTGTDGSIGDWVGAILADGMGGHAAGDIASSTVVQAIEDALRSAQQIDSNILNRSLTLSNQNIRSVMEEQPETRGMGSTLIAALVSRNRLDWVSVGDSPMYLMRGSKLTRLNADHSMAGAYEKMVEVGRMTRDEAENDPNRHVLRSSISGEEIELIDATTKENFLKEGDVLILASDGLDTLSNDEILSIVNQNLARGAKSIVDSLLQQVEEKAMPSQDNTTVIALICEALGDSGSARIGEEGVANRLKRWLGF